MKKYIYLINKIIFMILGVIASLNFIYFFKYKSYLNFISFERFYNFDYKMILIFILVLVSIFFISYKIRRQKVIFLLNLLIGMVLFNELFYFNQNQFLLFKKVYLSDRIKQAKYHKSIFQCSNKQIIAHAAGEINGMVYTNSLEALNNSYSKGIRLFELDIRYTKDGKLIALHELEQWKKDLNCTISGNLTLEEFRRYNKNYTLLDINIINDWFKEHNDAYLITDKINTPKDFCSKFIDCKRVKMELFTYDAIVEAVENNITAMPSWNTTLSKLKNPFLFLKKLNIEYIVIPYHAYKAHPNLFKILSNNGIKIYIYGLYGKKIIPMNYYYGRYVNDILLHNICVDNTLGDNNE